MEKRRKEDCYGGIPGIKRDNLQHAYTDEEIKEYKKCKEDPIYFCQHYVRVKSAGKIKPLDLYPYQKIMINNFQDHRFNVILAARQSGKSESSIAYLLWFAIFHTNKSIAMLAQKEGTAKKLFTRVRTMLKEMPFFLQPGCQELNKTSVTFSNGSVIFTGATSESSIRGDSVNLLYLDEFAFAPDASDFFAASYPVISADPDSRVIITSTANGVGNMYYELYTGSLAGNNDFYNFRVDWQDVPNVPANYVHKRCPITNQIDWTDVPMRDEAWKTTTIKAIGQRKFNQEYSNEFLSTGDGLINADTMGRLRPAVPIRTDEHMNIYEDCIPEHHYIMCVDVSHGVGLDYSTFNIIDVSTNPFKQVVTFRHNDMPAFLFPNEIYKWAMAYNEAYVIVESNGIGERVINDLYINLNYENMHLESFTDIKKMGVNMNRNTKNIGCNGFKNILESGRLDIIDAETISEIQTFQAKGIQGYEAIDGRHDDLVMNFVMFGYFIHTRFLHNATVKDLDIKQFMYEAKIKQIEETKVPFGYIKRSGDTIEEDIGLPPGWVLDTYDPDDYDDDPTDGAMNGYRSLEPKTYTW